MKLQSFYESIVKIGISRDPRGAASVQKLLKKEKEKYDKLKGDEKDEFDAERLVNPYADTRILHGDADKAEVKSIILGVDIETPEILLADTLRKNGRKIDLVMAHHPEGMAYANFYKVMNMQSDILSKFGVPINIAESLMDPRMQEVARRVMPANHTRAVDSARLLDFPYMCAHTPADNCVSTYLQDIFDKENPDTLDDVVKILKAIPEYKLAGKISCGPSIFKGSGDKRAGKVFVDMTGGTEGSKEIFENLANAGVGTVVGMHMSEDHVKNAEKYHIHVVIAGHISSDTLGLNILLDEIEKKHGKLEIIACSGFTRIKHS